MKSGFTLKDYWALIKMSMRSAYWRIDSRNWGKQLDGVLFWIVWIFPVGVVLALFNILNTATTFFALGVAGVIGELFKSFFLLVFCVPVTFNIKRMKYNINFKNSTWWNNTGIKPSEMLSDKGVYGEYIATIYAEEHLKVNQVYGKILNNVFIPVPGGSFNEIDMISISEIGIQVIEAKGRQGKLSGNWMDETLSQNGNEMQNPLIQNLNHCNYLVEYLYQKLPLPACEFKLFTDLFAFIKNVVLFSVYGIQDNINRSFEPNMDFYVGMSDKYANQRFKNRTLSKEQVDMIYETLLPVASYSPEERRQMIQQRELERQQKERLREQQMRTHTYKPNTVYYVVDMNFIDIDGKWYRGNVVCKERNCGMDENNEPVFYRTFLDSSDGWYYAKPNMTFNKRLTESDYNEATIIDIYNQKYNSPFLEK